MRTCDACPFAIAADCGRQSLASAPGLTLPAGPVPWLCPTAGHLVTSQSHPAGAFKKCIHKHSTVDLPDQTSADPERWQFAQADLGAANHFLLGTRARPLQCNWGCKEKHQQRL